MPNIEDISKKESCISGSTISTAIDLANFIKGTHKSLRESVQTSKDVTAHTVWEKHIEKKDHLEKYAQAMYTLATKYWDNTDNTSRINWIYNSIENYFYKGDLERRLEKEYRKVSTIKQNELPEFLRVRESLGKYEKNQRLQVLDVGSCYNPFAKFEDLDVTPIDLHPAKPDVFSCDFIALEVKNKMTKQDSNPCNLDCDKSEDLKTKNEATSSNLSDENAEEPSTKKFKSCTRMSSDSNYDITNLEQCSYDVVIFSLFLEYIPCPRMRFTCCQKAYQLLKWNGLLCIVAPDSKSEGVNSPLFKLWKVTLSNLGFNRIRYEKCSHFHGMTFRKGLIPSVWQDDALREIKEISSKSLRKKFSELNYDSILETVYTLQDIEDITKR